jgi:predicted proteasome-type protease
MLAAAQAATATTAIERVLGLAGNLTAVAPSVLDNLDTDEAIREYGAKLGTSPKMYRAQTTVAEMRAARDQKQQQIEQLDQTMAGVQGAKILSTTDVGGGQNALSAMIGT